MRDPSRPTACFRPLYLPVEAREVFATIQLNLALSLRIAVEKLGERQHLVFRIGSGLGERFAPSVAHLRFPMRAVEAMADALDSACAWSEINPAETIEGPKWQLGDGSEEAIYIRSKRPPVDGGSAPPAASGAPASVQ